MRRIAALFTLALGATAAISGSPDPSLSRMVDDIETAYGRSLPSGGAAASTPPGASKAEGLIAAAQPHVGDFNTLLTGARNAADLWDASNLLDKATDPNYEPDLSGEGAPDVPASLCGASEDCNACYASVFEGLDGARLNLEKLRVAGMATGDYVRKSIALGDGLSGVTGLAALEWQKQRVGINKAFDHFKGTYDSKYEGMMKNLKDVMDRWNACEAQYGERDWYPRFGFLYYQFLRDKYKRNF